MTALDAAFQQELEADGEGDDDELELDIPLNIELLIRRAIDLDELHQVGASFSYPDALTSEEWIALRMLQAARRKFEKREREREVEEREMAEREQRLRGILKN